MPDPPSLLNVYARPFSPSSNPHPPSQIKTPLGTATDRLIGWKFSEKDIKRMLPILAEWFFQHHIR